MRWLCRTLSSDVWQSLISVQRAFRLSIQLYSKEEHVGNFVTIGQASDLGEGEMKQVEVAGTKVAIANVAGSFYAFGDTCTHLGCSLSEGDLEETTVTCPCHGSMFDVTSGQVLRGPAKKSEPSYRVEVRDGSLWVEV